MQNLVIVESPSKAKTIEKFLGGNYKVLSSYGHIRDLKKNSFSIDVEHGFTPVYEIPAEKEKVVAQLRAEAAKADTVWLASDEDREGEAIAWHLFEVLGLKAENTKRIVFHEITKNAILNAIDHPRDIDAHLVDAQQARRVLDRVVGFELSPVLWRRVRPQLSAGRVQSVTVRLIVEREREIDAFVPRSYFRVTGRFTVSLPDGTQAVLNADLDQRFDTAEQAQDFVQRCASATFSIEGIERTPVVKNPAAPFTTSTLQQEASRRLGVSVSQVMRMAQELYENGHITYMRTDSVNLSSLALGACRKYIEDTLDKDYARTRRYTTSSKGAQEAHEAIRPTYIENTGVSASTSTVGKLYQLIWRRTVASQMAAAQMEKTVVSITIGGCKERFVATGEAVLFDGFFKVWRNQPDENAEGGDSRQLPTGLEVGMPLTRQEISATERFTQHQPRYTEATLVRKLEELGIGRPSTYAPIISTVQQRGYVAKGDKPAAERGYMLISLPQGDNIVTANRLTEKVGGEKSKLMPTDTGLVVNDFLIDQFPDIMDYNFTANVEKAFDEIADGQQPWAGTLRTFYDKFHPQTQHALTAHTEHKVGERVLGNDPTTGRVVSVKIGRFGPMAQMGTADDAEKPRFVKLTAEISMATATLEQVLPLFDLPRTLGSYEDADVVVNRGRFGPYVAHNGLFVSIPKGVEPLSISMDEAVQLIVAKREQNANKLIKAFGEEPELKILNGRFSPYIAYKGANYKIAKGTDAAGLTLQQCLDIVRSQGEKPRAGGTRQKTAATKAKKTAETKKTAASKKTATAKKTTATTKKAAASRKKTVTAAES